MIQKVSEDIDYVLTPAEDEENEQAWDVRILRGSFTETVVRFGNIKFDDENGCLRFSFVVIYSPDSDLTEDNEELQVFVGDILESVLENAIADGQLITNERTTDTE
tara:strand:+ start:205 stop:522 length:318 start_codon:yes stop_codon:yes gene_type:complete